VEVRKGGASIAWDPTELGTRRRKSDKSTTKSVAQKVNTCHNKDWVDMRKKERSPDMV